MGKLAIWIKEETFFHEKYFLRTGKLNYLRKKELRLVGQIYEKVNRRPFAPIGMLSFGAREAEVRPGELQEWILP